MIIEYIVTTESSRWDRRKASAESGRFGNLGLTGQRFQRIHGFGGCFNELGYLALQNTTADGQRQVMQSLFGDDGCQFNFCRVPIGANDYSLQWYSLNETDGDLEMNGFSIARDEQFLIPYIRQALSVRADIEFCASPWSPPTWMKTQRVCNHGTLRWERPILEAYALYFRKFVESYHQLGINVTQVHVQNEPTSDQKFPSCVWTGDQMREFIAEYIGPDFQKHNVNAEVWLGTINGPEADDRWPWTRFDQFANNVLSDANAAKYTAGVAYQWAGKHALQQTHNAYPHVPLIQSENECGDGKNSWQYALYVWELIQHYFTNHVVAYLYWNMILPAGGTSTWGWKQNSMITVDPEGSIYYQHEYWVMKHIAHFIRRGAIRLGLSGPWTSNALAFENPDGRVVVILANPFANRRSLKFAGGGMSVSIDLEPLSISTLVVKPYG